MTVALPRFRFGSLAGGSQPGSRPALRPITVAERLTSPRFGLLWLIRLRWHALVALALAMTLAPWLMGVSVPWLPAAGVVGGVGLSNLASLLWARTGRPVHTAVLGAVILGDTVLLTIALELSGGALNPCASLYVVQLTLAALLLGRGWVVAVGLASVAGYVALLLGADVGEAPAGIESALAALALTLGINGTLVVRMVSAFRERQEALVKAQHEAARTEKLASLATLAAGAAHELATPLGSIAVASTELIDLIAAAPEQALAEARLIREQVARCKHILQRMGARAGSEPGEITRWTSATEVYECVRRELGPRAERLETTGVLEAGGAPEPRFEAPVESLVGVLANLVSNGVFASAPGQHVTLSIIERHGGLRFTTRDRGHGIDPAILPRLGEPFFTTKPPGEGLGLGLFLAFRFAAACGGNLSIEAAPEGGTLVHLDLPKRPSTGDGAERANAANALRSMTAPE